MPKPVPQAADRKQRSIVLVGFMAAGKSKIGRRLAERLGLPFADADEAVEQEYGCSVADLFRGRGEGEFRAAERRHIARLVEGERQVIAVGGGAFVDPRNREALNAGARTIWLDTPFELVLPRLLASATRPLAANKSEQELRQLWHERRRAYETAHIRIDTSDADVEQIVSRILDALN